jgi:hypothetical protein
VPRNRSVRTAREELPEIAPPAGEEAVEPKPPRPVRIFLERHELPSWLPVSEPAFLLWVLLALILVWVGVAVFLTMR